MNFRLPNALAQGTDRARQFPGFLVLLGVLSCVVFQVQAAAVAETTLHTDGRGTPKMLFPPPSGAPAADNRSAAENYLKANAALLKLPADLSTLQLVETKESLLGTHYRYRQVLNSIPVEGGEVVVSVRRTSGEVYQVYNDSFPVSAAPPVAKARLSADAALEIAWNHLRVHGKLLAEPKAEPVYVPQQGGFKLAWKTTVAVRAPFGRWEHQIDAQTGKILSTRNKIIQERKQGRLNSKPEAYSGPVWSRLETTQQFEAAQVTVQQSSSLAKTTVNGTAKVFDGDPRTYLANESLVDSSPASAFTAAYVTRTLRDISLDNGVYSLNGPWVTIVDFDPPNTPPSTTSNGQWTAVRGDNAFNDAMVYFHIDQSQRYLQSLGFNNVQHAPIGADSDGNDGDDNSYYDPTSNELSFGHGDVDDDEDADVILHEYGHAITQSIVPSWGAGGDTGGIGEGFGDYWGGSYSSTTQNGTTFHPEWAFSWDGHSPDSWPGRFLNLTNLTYDPNHIYDAHETINGIDNYSDQLWSAPLFQSFLDLRAAGYPRTNVDQILIESFYGVGGSPTMRDMANAIVSAATQLFPAGPYAQVFSTRFLNQNILAAPPVPAAQFISPVGGETFSAGALVQVQWDRQGAPPEAAARLEYSTGAITFSDAMENGVNGWVVSHGAGFWDWAQVTTSSHSPSHSWFAVDQADISDQYLRSPRITIPAGAVLSFWHAYSLEEYFDGGVVEISTDGTTWYDLGSAATQNGYIDTIASDYSSPIGNRWAFTGSSGGFIQTLIPLDSYAGQSVYIRFRLASDDSEGDVGWWVDDVTIGAGWVPVGTAAAGASSYAWTVPSTPGTSNRLRIQQFAPGYSDSAWVQTGPFTINTLLPSPVIQSITANNGSISILCTAVSGHNYRLQCKTNLTDATWTYVGSAVPANGGTVSLGDNTPAARKFYRIQAQ